MSILSMQWWAVFEHTILSLINTRPIIRFTHDHPSLKHMHAIKTRERDSNPTYPDLDLLECGVGILQGKQGEASRELAWWPTDLPTQAKHWGPTPTGEPRGMHLGANWRVHVAWLSKRHTQESERKERKGREGKGRFGTLNEKGKGEKGKEGQHGREGCYKER